MAKKVLTHKLCVTFWIGIKKQFLIRKGKIATLDERSKRFPDRLRSDELDSNFKILSNLLKGLYPHSDFRVNLLSYLNITIDNHSLLLLGNNQQHLVYAVAIHVHYFKPKTFPLKGVSGCRNSFHVVQYETG